MDQALICTHCDTVLVKSTNGELKIRSKVIIFRDDKALAVCKGCGMELPVPLQLNLDMVKSLSSTSSVRLYINKK